MVQCPDWIDHVNPRESRLSGLLLETNMHANSWWGNPYWVGTQWRSIHMLATASCLALLGSGQKHRFWSLVPWVQIPSVQLLVNDLRHIAWHLCTYTYLPGVLGRQVHLMYLEYVILSDLEMFVSVLRAIEICVFVKTEGKWRISLSKLDTTHLPENVNHSST